MEDTANPTTEKSTTDLMERRSEAACSVVAYYVSDAGDTAFDFEEDEMTEHEAELAAQDYYESHDGWESKWPLDITLENTDGEKMTFKVDLEMTPNFYATERQNKADIAQKCGYIPPCE